MEGATFAVGALPWRAITRERSRSLTRALAGAVALGALLVLSAFLRTRALSVYYWIDEGLSVGIASHHFLAIPGVLRQDGSPPLYYMLLHLWMGVAGSGERATHALSLIIGLATVPAALWAGWSLFGARCGWLCASFAALNPFLSAYAQETRMYELVVLLALLATAAFLHAFVFGRRRYIPMVSVTLAALLYTHNWGLFLGIGMAAALGLGLIGGDRRRLLVDGALAFGGAALLFAPWLPTLAFQARHTGAPWALAPTWRAAQDIPRTLLGKLPEILTVLFVAGAGVVLALRREVESLTGDRPRPLERRALQMAIVILGGAVLSAWLFSKVSPAWAARYFALFLGPLLLVVGRGLARARGAGIAAMVVLAVLWGLLVHVPNRDAKSNVGVIARVLTPRLHPGDVILATHPEEVPVLHRYLPASVSFATPLGPVPDPAVMDWRDALARLRQARVATNLEPLLDRMPVGSRIVIVFPIIRSSSQWRAPWTRLVRRRSTQWTQTLAHDPRFVPLSEVPRRYAHTRTHVGAGAILYLKRNPIHA